MMRWGAFLGLGGLIGLIFEKKKKKREIEEGKEALAKKEGK